MTDQNQSFPNDPLLRTLHAYREPPPPQSEVEREARAKQAEEAAAVAAKAAKERDEEAVRVYAAYKKATPFYRAAIRRNYGSDLVERGRALSEGAAT